ncbi:hypothetical protein B0H63DRAFT_534468 [Podospora didyma]|uniref:Uncharacterized protein n=1 Tax=Podospora didyma TaxID=330526 RepID=A0AAE0K2M6_9PEZI|nr:hypothetical protein B0H63DRAFT_534468 [Podospora didyma]
MSPLSTLSYLYTLGLASYASGLVITPSTSSDGGDLTIQTCFKGETSSLLCYRGTNGTSQDVTPADVAYIANYLRRYGRENPKKPNFLTMKGADTADCGEWSLYTRKSAKAVAKHLDPKIDSSVLFEDIANTIDGGVKTPGNATIPITHHASVADCLSDGGSLGVVVNATHPAYLTPEYLAPGFTTKGILIKIVASGVTGEPEEDE